MPITWWAQSLQEMGGVCVMRPVTVLVFDAALVEAVGAGLGLELDVAEFQHGGHQLQHRLHLVLHETHDLHGILRESRKHKQKKSWIMQILTVSGPFMALKSVDFTKNSIVFIIKDLNLHFYTSNLNNHLDFLFLCLSVWANQKQEIDHRSSEQNKPAHTAVAEYLKCPHLTGRCTFIHKRMKTRKQLAFPPMDFPHRTSAKSSCVEFSCVQALTLKSSEFSRFHNSWVGTSLRVFPKKKVWIKTALCTRVIKVMQRQERLSV